MGLGEVVFFVCWVLRVPRICLFFSLVFFFFAGVRVWELVLVVLVFLGG